MQFSVLRARAGPVSGRGCREQRVRTAASPLQGLASAEPRSAVRRSARALDRSESHSVPRAPATSAFLQASAERAGSAAVGRPPSRGPLPAPAKPLVVAFDGTANAEDTLRWALDNMALQGEAVRLVHVVVDPRGLGSASVPVGTLGTGRPLPGTAFASPQQGTQGALQQYAQRLTADARHMLAARAEPLLAGRPGSEILTPLVSGARSAATIGEAVVDEAHNRGRLLVVANHGPGAKAGIGSVARYCYQRLDVPLVLVPPRSTAHNMPPTVPGHHSTQPSPSSAIMFAARSTAELAVMWTQLASACGSSLLRRSSSSNSGGGGGGDVARVLLLDGSHVPADVKAQMLAAGFSAVEECGPLAVTTGNSHAVAPPASGGVIDDHSAAVGAALLELCSSQQPGGGGASVRGQAAAVRLLVMANYARAGMLREVMDGGVAAYASCHHTLPLVLVPLPGA